MKDENVENYLDFNKFIKVEYIIDDSAIDFQFIVETNDDKLNDILNGVLENIATVEETDTQYKIFLNGVEFIDISKETEEIEFINKLTTTEMRLLTRDNSDIAVPFSREKNNDYAVKSDLNSSFDGAIMSDTLIRVGKENDLKYPIDLLQEIGIDVEKYSSVIRSEDSRYINLELLEDENIKLLEDNLKMSPLTVETSKELNKIYRLREPFTSNKDLFPKYLEEIAKNYHNNGIEYAELSFSGFLEDPEYVHILDETLPQVEEKYGVDLRFLVELSGNSNKELRKENIEVIKNLNSSSPYIVGCDIKRGNNQEEIYEAELRELTGYAMQNPAFVIKVNAGETQRQQKNISKILKIVSDEHDKLGKKLPYPQLHIGSGIYGWKGTDLENARKMGAIVIFDISASFVNNNVYSIENSSIKRCLNSNRGKTGKFTLKNQSGVVLGTSGMGIYSTSPQEEILLARALGVNIDELEKIKKDEEKYIQIQRENKTEVKDKFDKIEEGIEKASGARVKFKKNKERNITETVSSLNDFAKRLGIEIDVDKINETTSGKIPILISGASEDTWSTISPIDQKNIEIALQVLADVIDPQKAFIVTGGTNIGVEKRMHEAVSRRNTETKLKDDKIVALGTLTLEAAKNDLEGVERNTITHALILEENGKAIETWDEFPNAQLEYIKNKDGILIAIGGGPAVSDMIELANKKGIQKHLMDGPNGASTKKSKIYKKDSFKIAEELITRIYESNPDILKKGIIKLKEDGKTLDLTSVINEAKKEIKEKHKSEELNERFCYRALDRSGHDINSADSGETIYCKPYYEGNEFKKENDYSIELSTHVANGNLDSKYISSTKQIGIAKHKYAYNDFYQKDVQDMKRTPIILIDRKKLNHAEYDLSNDEKIKEIREFRENPERYKSNLDKTKADKEVIIEEEIPSNAYKVVPPILVDVLDLFERSNERYCQLALNEMITNESINDNGKLKNINEFLNDIIKKLDLNDVEKFVIQEYYNNMYNMQTVANKFKEICVDNANISNEMILKTLTGVKMQIVKKFMQNKKSQEKIEELKIVEMQELGVTPRYTNYKGILDNSYEFTEGTVSATDQKYDNAYSTSIAKNVFIQKEQNLKIMVKKDKEIYLPIGMEYDLEHHKIKSQNYILAKSEAGVYPKIKRDFWDNIEIRTGNELEFNEQKLRKYLISIKEQKLQQREQIEAECDKELEILEQGLNVGD